VVRVARMLGPLIEDDSFFWMAPRIVLRPGENMPPGEHTNKL